LENWREGSTTGALKLFGTDCQDIEGFQVTNFESMTDVEKLWFGQSMPFSHLSILRKQNKFSDSVQNDLKRVFDLNAKSIFIKVFTPPLG